MARTEVSSVIRDILDAFSNGLHIVKGNRPKHKRRNSQHTKDVDREKQARESLTTRPQQIQKAYEESVVKHGRRFEVGDSTSQNGLAQILLRLNTGLIKLLNQALSPDKASRPTSETGIFSLSEAAAIDTLSVMSELSVRLLSTSRIDLGVSVHRDEYKATARKSGSPQGVAQDCKRPPATPLLQYGGWVRSKTSPSVVSIVAAPRSNKTEIRRKSRSRSQSVTELGRITTASPGRLSPPPKYAQVEDDHVPIVKAKPRHLRSQSEKSKMSESPNTNPELTRHPSMYLVTSDFFKSFPQHATIHEVHTMDASAALNPPLKVIPQQDVADYSYRRVHTVHGQQVRPPSMMTFMTASTKIGEIPEHRLPGRDLNIEQQAVTPMPYVIPDMLEPKKRSGRGLKFWKKDRSGVACQQHVAA